MRRGRPWRALLSWVLVVLGGILVGLLLAGAVTWVRAHLQVQRYIQDPPQPAPGVIWSAPMEIRVGQPGSIQELGGDLLAAGYSRVAELPDDPEGTDPVGLFAVEDGSLHIWTEAMGGPGFQVPAGRTTLHLKGDRVASTDPESGVRLRPTVLATVGDPASRRTEVDLDALPPVLEAAILAIEDERFRQHEGLDFRRILRALERNIRAGETLEGGSTLSQQLAKNLFLTPERTLRRKVREAFLALALEARLSKDDLLELYLGETYFGQMGGLPLYGVEQASIAWFGKSARFVDTHEAALLAGVIAAPNRWSPVRNPEAALARRDVVLARMVEVGALDPQRAAAAKAEPLQIEGLEPSRVRRAPYAVDYLVDQVERELGAGTLATGGYQVWTWIQPQLQRTAEQAVRDGLKEVRRAPRRNEAQAALVALRVEDGGIVAMVGGGDYVKSPFNRAVTAMRQAGSTVKPLTLLAALHSRQVTLSDRLLDAPVQIGEGRNAWRPSNYDRGHRGQITVRAAIEQSRNIPAVLLAQRVGPERLQRTYRQLGLTEATAYPSAALGAFEVSPLQMASAYTVFPNQGVHLAPLPFRAITTADGRVVLQGRPQPHRVASEGAATLARSVLEGVIHRGTGASARSYGVRGPVGGKTGTTDRFRDAWFVGFSPELSVAVWVGVDRGELGLPGSQGALPTWARFMSRTGPPPGPFSQATQGVEEHEICQDSGQLATPRCPNIRAEIFSPGTNPRTPCALHGAPPSGIWGFGGEALPPQPPTDPQPLSDPDLDPSPDLPADGEPRDPPSTPDPLDLRRFPPPPDEPSPEDPPTRRADPPEPQTDPRPEVDPLRDPAPTDPTLPPIPPPRGDPSPSDRPEPSPSAPSSPMPLPDLPAVTEPVPVYHRPPQ